MYPLRTGPKWQRQHEGEDAHFGDAGQGREGDVWARWNNQVPQVENKGEDCSGLRNDKCQDTELLISYVVWYGWGIW